MPEFSRSIASPLIIALSGGIFLDWSKVLYAKFETNEEGSFLHFHLIDSSVITAIDDDAMRVVELLSVLASHVALAKEWLDRGNRIGWNRIREYEEIQNELEQRDRAAGIPF